MPWLVSNDVVLASAEVLGQRKERVRGLLGRPGVEGAVVLRPCRWVHTIGMSFAIDVAFLDRKGVVLKMVHMPKRRVGVPVLRARTVVEAEAGAFSRWGLKVGDTIDVTD